MLAFWSRSSSYRRAPEAPARCEEAFFVVPGLSSVRGRAASTLAPAPALMVVPRERAGLNRGVPASRAEYMARRSDQRGQGPRPGPVPRAPRGLLHPRAVVEGEEAENESGGASIAPHARPRMRVAALPSHRIDPAGRAAVRPPHTRAVASPPLRACPAALRGSSRPWVVRGGAQRRGCVCDDRT